MPFKQRWVMEKLSEEIETSAKQQLHDGWKNPPAPQTAPPPRQITMKIISDAEFIHVKCDEKTSFTEIIARLKLDPELGLRRKEVRLLLRDRELDPSNSPADYTEGNIEESEIKVFCPSSVEMSGREHVKQEFHGHESDEEDAAVTCASAVSPAVTSAAPHWENEHEQRGRREQTARESDECRAQKKARHAASSSSSLTEPRVIVIETEHQIPAAAAGAAAGAGQQGAAAPSPPTVQILQLPEISNPASSSRASHKGTKVHLQIDRDFSTWTEADTTELISKFKEITGVKLRDVAVCSGCVVIDALADFTPGQVQALLSDTRLLNLLSTEMRVKVVLLGSGLDIGDHAKFRFKYNKFYTRQKLTKKECRQRMSGDVPAEPAGWVGDCPDKISRGGEPYYCPVNWQKYGVHVDNFEQLCHGWPVVYHGTKSAALAPILYSGLNPSTSGDYGPGFYLTPVSPARTPRKAHPSMAAHSQASHVLTLSLASCPLAHKPNTQQSIVYAAFDRYAEWWTTPDGTEQIQLVLQIRVNPKCVPTAWRRPQTLVEPVAPGAAVAPIDPNFSNDVLEWVIPTTNTEARKLQCYAFMVRSRPVAAVAAGGSSAP